MFSQTRRAIEDFDNQHDFERMAADILNALEYENVEPMAPCGGSDGGRDIKFREGDTPGIAFVTLEKKLKDKFKRDLSKQGDAEAIIALFCNVDVSPSMKLTFARDAIAKGYILLVFDLERLRSLLDSSLKGIRQRYLHIDDEVAAKLRFEVLSLLKYPDAVPETSPPPTRLEQMLVDKLPYRIFDLLMHYEEKDIAEVPQVGSTLEKHLKLYYEFRQKVRQFESDLMAMIAELVGDRFNSKAIWQMYFDYALPRFFGNTKEQIITWGNFLNYGVTWEETERVFSILLSKPELASQIDKLDESIALITQNLGKIG